MQVYDMALCKATAVRRAAGTAYGIAQGTTTWPRARLRHGLAYVYDMASCKSTTCVCATKKKTMACVAKKAAEQALVMKWASRCITPGPSRGGAGSQSNPVHVAAS